MTLFEVIGLVLALIVIGSTLANFIDLDAWWIRLFDFPRLQLVVTGIAALLICVATSERIWSWQSLIILLLMLGLLDQIRRILPFTPLMPKEVKSSDEIDDSRRLSLLISNVLMSNRRAVDLLNLIEQKKPDLVLTLESDEWWQEQLATLEHKYPYNVKQPLDNLYGMHLYSRLELEDATVKYLVDDEIPSIHGWVKLGSGEKVRLHCLHPTPPAPPQNDSSAERDAELLIVAREVSQRNTATVVAGDLNDVAWSKTTRLFQKISGLLDPRRGRGVYSTFHAQYRFLRWPLDHVFHSSDFTLVEIKRLPDIGSDHFPIYVKLQLMPHEPATQEKPEADAEDKEWASEKIARADKP